MKIFLCLMLVMITLSSQTFTQNVFAQNQIMDIDPEDPEAPGNNDGGAEEKQEEKKEEKKVDPAVERLRKKQSQLDNAQREKNSLKNGLTNLQKVKEELEKSKSDLSNYVYKLDGTLNEITYKLQEIQRLVDEKKKSIEVTSAQLVVAKDNEKKQYADMRTRIQFMYEKRTDSYFDMLFSAKSIGELLNRAEYIEKMSKYDRDMLAVFKETRETIADYEEQLKVEKGVLEEAEKSAEAEKATMESLIAEKKEQIDVFENDISNKEEAIKQYEKEIAEQDSLIASLEAAVAAERESTGTGRDYDGGTFAFPAPSYTRISDDFGWRIHPILNVKQFHNGVDLASPGGSPILAAYDGTVIAADYSSTMGNYIMIDHGGGLYTIYMHASALYVSKGESVSRKQQIAAIGSTGRSTGNHLHFSVRLNGGYVSPWNYL